MGLEVFKAVSEVGVEGAVTRGIDVPFEAVQVVSGVEVVVPLIFFRRTVHPCAIRPLSRATVDHGFARGVNGSCVAGQSGSLCEKGSREHVGVVDGILLERDVADTAAGVSPLSRQTQ